MFGTLKANGYRQFNTAYIEIPKKQGKSELAAAVALLLTCGDGEERAEVYGCAADRQQASIVFNVAADMVRMCPALAKRVKILDSQKRLIYQPTGSIYQVLSADVGNKHGFNTHGVVFDELHTQPNRKLFDVMTKGSGDARMQPLYFLITTAGNDTKSICYEIHQKAKDIIEGRKTGRAADEYNSSFWNVMRSKAPMPQVVNALQVGDDAEGGYLVPDEYERHLVEALEEENVFRRLAHTINTDSGERKIPVVASKGTANWIDEEGPYLFLYTKSNSDMYYTTAGNLSPSAVATYSVKTYAVTYNANGGSGAPSTQYKTHGTALTLSSTKPTKASTSPGNYTVTLNANGGTCSSASLTAKRTTAYTFSTWNTNSSGTGTSYASGASYTTNAALSLYAIYSSSTTTDSVTLPTPTRDGYDFMGWAMSASATSGTTGSYKPSGNVTLYAIWGAKGLVYIGNEAYQIYIGNGSSWDLYAPYVGNGTDWDLCS